ncbi:MAG: TROVE domain-containing protein [Dehalococcoidales bacterium]|jgi:hypothetical protein
MSTFNKKVSTSKKLESHPSATKNHEDALAFKMSPKLDLYTRVATCLYGQDKFYVTGKQADSELQSVLSTVIAEDPKFVLDLAKYTRNKLYLRSVPQVLLAEVFNQSPGTVGAYKYVPEVVKRADEITEVLAYQLNRNAATGTRGDGQKKIPKSLQKGLRLAMQNFGEYHYAKYNKDGEVTFKDAMTLVRPKPKDSAQAAIFEKLVNGESLPIPDTWEMITTIKGSNKASWEEAAEKTPYMATIRNLNNFLRNDIGNLDVVIDRLTNEAQVLKSKQLPFRFYSAYREIQNNAKDSRTNKVLDAIDTAMEISIKNVPNAGGKTAVLVDLSGSMQSKVSGKSTVSMREIASVFGAISSKVFDDCVFYGFGDTSKVIPLSKRSSIIDNVEKINQTNVGCSTNAHLPVLDMIKNGTDVDRIILFSDMQCYNSGYSGTSSGYSYGYDVTPAFFDYRKKVNQNTKLYSIDLTGYGTVKWPENTRGIYTISGWSNSIFNFIDAVEKGEKDILSLIN